MTINPRLRARLRRLQLQRSHLAGNRKIAVIEDERARDAVLIKFKADRVDRRLLTALFVLFVLFLKIADGYWPAGELCLFRHLPSRILGRLFAGCYRAANNCEGIIEFLAGFRSVIDWKFQNGLALARGGNNSPHVFGRKYRTGRHGQILFLRLAETYRHRFGVSLGLAVNDVRALFVKKIFRIEAEFLGLAVFPSGRAQIAERGLAFTGV